MKHSVLVIVFVLAQTFVFGQLRNVNKLTLEGSYTNTEIHKSLRDLVDGFEKSNYFDDDFFNGMLKKLLSDKQFSEKEKVQLFYLMQKKLGFAFVGLAYLPPQQNYFECQAGKALTYNKTKATLRDLNYQVTSLLQLADSNVKKDVLLCSNALLLATLLQPDSALSRLESYASFEIIQSCKNPDILNHYLCLCAAVANSSHLTEQIVRNLSKFNKAEYIEDILCAMYSRNHSFSNIKDYILSEHNPANTRSIETALCILAAKVPEATFEKSVKSFISESKEKWKSDHMKKILKKQLPFGYSQSNANVIVVKSWPGVTVSSYAEGQLISNGTLLEFDPN